MAIQQVIPPSVEAQRAPARSASADAVPPAHAPVPEAPPARLTAAQVEQMVQEVRKLVEPVAQNLHFSIDKGSGRTIVKVVDAKTEEVIRQIPSEEFLAISKSLDKLQGLLLRQEG